MNKIPLAVFQSMTDEAKAKFNGITDTSYTYAYRKNGKIHRDLGPANISKNTDEVGYYIEGFRYNEKEYWGKMLEKYKGTDHETYVLVKILMEKE